MIWRLLLSLVVVLFICSATNGQCYRGSCPPRGYTYTVQPYRYIPVPYGPPQRYGVGYSYSTMTGPLGIINWGHRSTVYHYPMGPAR